MFFSSDLGITALQDYFAHFESSKSFGGAKTGDPREKTPDHKFTDYTCLYGYIFYTYF